jgi:hypothetical protein
MNVRILGGFWANPPATFRVTPAPDISDDEAFLIFRHQTLVFTPDSAVFVDFRASGIVSDTVTCRPFSVIIYKVDI